MSVRLETERLVLRFAKPDDADGLAEYLTDPEVMRYLGGATVPREDVPSVMERWLHRWEATGFGHFVIERREDRRVLGRAGVLVWDTRDWRHGTITEADEHAQPELGWALAREHWRYGYATEAARAVRKWARHDRGVQRLISLINADNVRSQRVAERLGATPTETVTLFDSGPAVVWVHPL
jgi:RimJ/RimL family protein N-acetyltransferase